jgi:hypothetical protein
MEAKLAWATAKQLALINYNLLRTAASWTPETGAKKSLEMVESFLLDAGFNVGAFDKEKQELYAELIGKH